MYIPHIPLNQYWEETVKGAGERNMTPLLKSTGWWVRSGETKGSSKTRGFSFYDGSRDCNFRDSSNNLRAFTVRSRNDG